MATKRLSICVLLAEPYNAEMPARPAVMEMSMIAIRLGHKVVWVMPVMESMGEMHRYKGIRIFTISHGAHSSLAGKIVDKFVFAWREMTVASRVVQYENCNVIQARDDVLAGLVAVYLKKKHRLPFVFQCSFPFVDGIGEKHRSMPFQLIVKVGHFVLSYVMRHADLILPISKWMREDLISKGVPKSKMVPLPLGVNTSLFSPTNNTHPEYDVIYIGTLDKLRRLDALIRAMVIVKQHNRHARLLMLGRGDDRSNLVELVHNCRLDDNVAFVDQVPYSDVPQFIASASIGVSPVPPSDLYKMNSPSKLFEYMSMGKPVVANEEIYEHKEVLESSGGGILVSFTPESFAGAILKLLDNSDEATKMGQAGRKWVIENRSYETLTRQVGVRYLELIQDNCSKT